MTAQTCGALTGATAGMGTNYLLTPGHALILMNVKILTDALELASMNQEVISATVLPDTESQQMGGPVKTLMNVKKSLPAGEATNTVTIHVEATSVQMWVVLKDMKRKAPIATDAREPPGDADQQTLSASENQCLSLSTLCHSFPICRLGVME